MKPHDEKHISALNNLAATYIQEGWYDNALSPYKTLVELVPDSDEFHYNLAVVQMALGNLTNAAIRGVGISSIDAIKSCLTAPGLFE